MVMLELSKEEEFMNVLGNLIWWLFGGLFLAFAWLFIGLILCVTVIGIPFGVQCLKISGFVFWPFGRNVEVGDFGVGGLLLNIIWILLVGWELAMAHLVSAFFCAITVIGIPFAIQHVKLAKLSFIPFGAEIH